MVASRDDGGEAAGAGEARARGGLFRALLRVPVFYKILIANSVIVVLGAIGGTSLTLHLLRSEGGGLNATGLGVALALAGVAITLLVNALILRLALSPMSLLEETAAQVQAGDLDARVPESALADRQMERLTGTFNAMLDNLEAYQQRLREVAARALHAEEEERKRIARELHDDTAQMLAALLIRLRLAARADDAAAREELFEQLRREVGEALERIRRFARGLRPPALDELGLVPALESHIRSLGESVGMSIRLEAEPVADLLSSQAELALYRITQEAISNAVRHSGAEQILVRITRAAGTVEVAVADDGRGFDVDEVLEGERSGLGLFGMQERAAYVGGRVSIQSRPGRGTEVRASAPVADREARARSAPPQARV